MPTERPKSAASRRRFIHTLLCNSSNGVAVYATDIYRKVPGDKLGGCNAQAAFDIEKAPFIMPMAEATPLIYFEYRKATITPAELYAPRQLGVIPALWHGVKDGSAREAVRARHINFTDKVVASRQPVYTYYQPVPGGNSEKKAILVLWAQAWKSRGFNPIVLRAQDAVKNAARYTPLLPGGEPSNT